MTRQVSREPPLPPLRREGGKGKRDRTRKSKVSRRAEKKRRLFRSRIGSGASQETQTGDKGGREIATHSAIESSCLSGHYYQKKKGEMVTSSSQAQGCVMRKTV